MTFTAPETLIGARFHRITVSGKGPDDNWNYRFLVTMESDGLEGPALRGEDLQGVVDALKACLNNLDGIDRVNASHEWGAPDTYEAV